MRRKLVSAIFVAALSLIVSAENLQQVAVTNDQFQQRLQLVSEIQKLELWEAMTAVQQERLRQAILLDKKPPQLWSRIGPYERIVSPENAQFLWRLTHLAPHLRDFYMDKLPAVPHEDTVEAAAGKTWWRHLSGDEQKELARLILQDTKIPKGWGSWKRAIQDEGFGQWIRNHRDIISAM